MIPHPKHSIFNKLFDGQIEVPKSKKSAGKKIKINGKIKSEKIIDALIPNLIFFSTRNYLVHTIKA